MVSCLKTILGLSFNNFSFTELKDLTFIFFSTSYFVQTSDYKIFPAEIALSKFSFSRGVYDKLHMFINPGELPRGYSADALMHSKKTHKRPLPPNIEGETDYKIILLKILEFIGCSEQKIPPLYVEEDYISDDFHAAVLTWEMIKKETSNENIKLRLYPTPYLLLRLFKISKQDRSFEDKKCTSLAMAKQRMLRDRYRYSEIGCHFHNSIDSSEYCCLSKVQRWGFIFADQCLDQAIDKFVPGHHYPLHLQQLPDSEIVSSSEDSRSWNSGQTDSLRRFPSSDNLTSESTQNYVEASSKINLDSSDSNSVFGSLTSFDVTPNTDLENSIDNLREQFPTGSFSKLAHDDTQTIHKEDETLSELATVSGNSGTESNMGFNEYLRLKNKSSVQSVPTQSHRIAASLTSSKGSQSLIKKVFCLGRGRGMLGTSKSLAQATSKLLTNERPCVSQPDLKNTFLLSRGRGSIVFPKNQGPKI